MLKYVYQIHNKDYINFIFFFYFQSLANSKYYKGGFDPKMSKREASLILGVSPTANKQRIKVLYSLGIMNIFYQFVFIRMLIKESCCWTIRIEVALPTWQLRLTKQKIFLKLASHKDTNNKILSVATIIYCKYVQITWDYISVQIQMRFSVMTVNTNDSIIRCGLFTLKSVRYFRKV